MGWDDLYDEVQTGVTGVDSATYRVKVDAVRPRAQSRLLFVDWEILAGTQAGKIAQANIWLPKPGDRNAQFHFRNKIAGFGDLSATFAAMAAADPNGDNVEAALDILAQALLGKTVDADISLRGEDAGKYAGTNEVTLTKPVDAYATTATPAAPAAPAAAPAPVAEAAPVAAAPAAAPVAAPAAVDVPF